MLFLLLIPPIDSLQAINARNTRLVMGYHLIRLYGILRAEYILITVYEDTTVAANK